MKNPLESNQQPPPAPAAIEAKRKKKKIKIKSSSKKLAKFARKPQTSTRIGKENWQIKFLKALSQKPNVTAACRSAGITTPRAYTFREESSDFRKRWDVAVQEGIETLESKCFDRAANGVPRGVWRNDEEGRPIKVEVIREFSDTLAITMLKAHAPHKYRERTEITGANGSALMPAVPIILHVSPEEIPRGKPQPAAAPKPDET